MLKEVFTRNFDKSQFELLYCNESNNTWDCVDKYIVDFIKLLNENENIITLFSCEGHDQDDSPYLYFKVNEIGWDIFWQKVLPRISYEFSSPFDIVDYVPDESGKIPKYMLKWYMTSTDNEYNTGITIYCDLNNIDYRGKIVITWEQKKERFWNTIKEAFLNNFPAKLSISCSIR